MKTQFVTDIKGEKVAVILPIKAYQNLLDQLEDQDDLRLYDEAKAEKGNPVSLEGYLQKRSSKKK